MPRIVRVRANPAVSGTPETRERREPRADGRTIDAGVPLATERDRDVIQDSDILGTAVEGLALVGEKSEAATAVVANCATGNVAGSRPATCSPTRLCGALGK